MLLLRLLPPFVLFEEIGKHDAQKSFVGGAFVRACCLLFYVNCRMKQMSPEAVHSSLLILLRDRLGPGHHFFEENGQSGDRAPQVEVILAEEKNLQVGNTVRWIGIDWDVTY